MTANRYIAIAILATVTSLAVATSDERPTLVPSQFMGAAERLAARRARREADAAVAIDHNGGSSPLLLLTGPRYARSNFNVSGRPLAVVESPNASAGTGLNAWDGAFVLAKYLEVASDALSLRGARVVELGAGTGVAGIAAAALGGHVVATDLPYTLDNLRAAGSANVALWALDSADGKHGSWSAMALDWFESPAGNCSAVDAASPQPLPPSPLVGTDIILGADVVWIPELIAPFVRTLVWLLRAGSPVSRAYIAHQTRAAASDVLFFGEMRCAGLAVELVPARELHPDYAGAPTTPGGDDAIRVWVIRAAERSEARSA